MSSNSPQQPTFSSQDVEVLERKRGFDGFFKLDTLKLRHRLFKGGWGEEIQREVFVRGAAVVVQLYDPATDRVAFTEQFRAGAMAEERGPWVWESVAGMVEEGETPEDVARRELVEESGVEEAQLEFICEYLPSPGGTDEKVYLYCGLADLNGVEGVYGLPEEGEDIRVVTMPLDEAVTHIATGFNTAATIMALQWLQLNKARLCHHISSQ
ncbi:MAG: NUDIX domain-containing protein [Cellvibrionaceae bacterium]